MFYLLRDRFEEARPLYLRALDLREKAFGADHPKLADDLEFYAVLLSAKRHEQEASEMETRAKAIRAKHGQ